jgi:hypothetical protein
MHRAHGGHAMLVLKTGCGTTDGDKPVSPLQCMLSQLCGVWVWMRLGLGRPCRGGGEKAVPFTTTTKDAATVSARLLSTFTPADACKETSCSAGSSNQSISGGRVGQGVQRRRTGPGITSETCGVCSEDRRRGDGITSETCGVCSEDRRRGDGTTGDERGKWDFCPSSRHHFPLPHNSCPRWKNSSDREQRGRWRVQPREPVESRSAASTMCG